MKAIFKSSHLLLLAITGVLSLTTVSCKKDDPVTPPAANTITDVVVNGADFSTLEAAVLKAGLAETLKGAGPFTVFAPDNAAFTATGITSIDGYSADELKKILLYHTLARKVMAADVPAGPNAPVSTANDPAQTLYVTKNASGVFINGIKVKTADVAADNGVIHVVEKVLVPPAGTLLETAVALGSNTSATGFSLLVAAVLRADAATPNGAVTAALSGAGPLTVFAPTNAAFIAAGFPTVESIQAADPAVLRNIILYHVVPARVFSSDLAAGEVTMAQSGKVTVALPSSGATVLGAGNSGTASNIIATNFVATNGVIHVIDRVLLP